MPAHEVEFDAIKTLIRIVLDDQVVYEHIVLARRNIRNRGEIPCPQIPLKTQQVTRLTTRLRGERHKEFAHSNNRTGHIENAP